MRPKPPPARSEADDVPGPGAYHSALGAGPDSPSAPSYSMRSRTSAMGPEGPEAGFPGPGSYRLPSMESGPAFTIRARPEKGGGGGRYVRGRSGRSVGGNFLVTSARRKVAVFHVIRHA